MNLPHHFTLTSGNYKTNANNHILLQKLCQYDETDPDGCGYEDVCIDIGRDSQGALCDMDWCPPLCSGAQTLQDNGVDAIGCPVAPTCV